MSLDRFRVVSPGEGIVYEFPPLAMTIVVLETAEDTGGELTLIESRHEPGSGAPLHVHHRQHETGYVVEGEFLIRRGDEPLRRVGPGTYAHFPMGEAHAFKCVGDKPGNILFWMRPGGYERFFAEAVEIVGADPSRPPDMDALAELGKEHDVDFVGPMIEEEG